MGRAGLDTYESSRADDLHEAKRRHSSAADVDSVALAEHFVAVYEGSLILAKAKGDAAVLEENVEHFRRYVELLFEGGDGDG